MKTARLDGLRQCILRLLHEVIKINLEKLAEKTKPKADEKEIEKNTTPDYIKDMLNQ